MIQVRELIIRHVIHYIATVQYLEMPVLTTYAKQRILVHYCNGHKAPKITKLCKEEGITVHRSNVWRFLRNFVRTGCLGRKEGSGRPSVITREVELIVEEQMTEDDETTAYQLHKILNDRGMNISIYTILRCRKRLTLLYNCHNNHQSLIVSSNNIGWVGPSEVVLIVS